MPFPLNSGGRIAIYDALNMLSRKYTLVLVIIDDDKRNEKYLRELKLISEEIYFFSHSKFQCILHSLLGLIKGKPLQVGYFYFNRIQKQVNEIALSCDCFYAFMIRTTSYGLNLPLKKGNYAIDSMYLNYKKSKDKGTSLLWKLIYHIELPLLFKVEKEQVSKFDMTTFVNKDEAKFWSKFGNVTTLPHGVESSILKYDHISDDYKHVVAFIGRMDYQPNIDAVMWFCNNVLSKLNDEIEFWIIGGYATPAIKSLPQLFKNVKIKGFVDDPYVILRSCNCTVAPMQTGGGLQTKILMAMAVESIVVTSSLPISAIENAKDNVNLIVEDNPQEMAKKINLIYENPSAFEYIRGNARKLIEQTYSLPVIEKKLLELVEIYL